MVSIKDVAAKAGVSLTTASIVINGKSKERKISEKTQQRVMKSMQELHYIPNVSAKQLRKGDVQKYIIAVFWSMDYRSSMMVRFIKGLQNQINTEKAKMNVIIHTYQAGKLENEAESFRQGDFHAAIIANASMEDLAFLEKEDFTMPIVLYNRYLEKYSSVNIDDGVVGETGAKHMIRMGYHKPVIIHGSSSFPGATKREEVFAEVMKMNKFDVCGHYVTENSIKGGAECASKLLAAIRRKKIDSIVCSSDAIALGVSNRLQREGIKIPEDIGIIAVGNIDPQYAEYNNPSITVIDIPISKMGAGCLELVTERLNNYMAEPRRIFFLTELFPRESTNRQ